MTNTAEPVIPTEPTVTPPPVDPPTEPTDTPPPTEPPTEPTDTPPPGEPPAKPPVEDRRETVGSPRSPKTGDATAPLAIALLGCAALGASVVTGRSRRR